MSKSELLIELIRYGSVLSDREFIDEETGEYRIRLFLYNDNKYLVIQRNGDPMAIEEVL